MKNKLLILIILLLAITLCSCKKKPVDTTDHNMENSDLKISSNLPIKVEYLRRWSYGEDFETTDPELMTSLVSKLQEVKLYDKVDYRVDDYTDIIILHYEDQSQKLIEIEESNIIIDGTPYQASNLDSIRLILTDISEAQ